MSSTADKVRIKMPPPPALGHVVGSTPHVYKHDPAVVRSTIYAQLGQNIPSLEEVRREIDSYNAVFLGRKDLPVVNGVTDMMEFAIAIVSRLSEIEGLILRGENGPLPGFGRGSPWQRFRTGELRSALRIAERQADLGSRRLTFAQMQENLRYR